MVRSHSWMEGFFKLGSKAPTLAARRYAWFGGVRKPEGVSVGAPTLVGNPWLIRFAVPPGAAQPAVVVTAPAVLILLTQFSMNPGILPAMDVTWKVLMVSNSHPYPARTAVLWSGDHAIPRRGPSEPRLLFLYQPSALTKETGPLEPSTGPLGTSVCWASEGGGLISQRTPPVNTRFGRMCHSSCTYTSYCLALV